MTHEIVINSVSKAFKDKSVLHEIDFDMDAGRIYGFIGPSGAGKTTLVRMIAGIETPTAGSIYIMDKLVPDISLLNRIGFMAQSDALYLELTGKENLEFYTALFTMKRRIAQERIQYVARVVGLTQDLPKKVCQYSGGMKRRLSLAIALLHNPDILILDEPTVGIDPELRQTIWNELNKLKSNGKLILITTHVMDEAERCDYIAMIKDGTILAQGTPAHLKKDYRAQSFDEVFIKAGKGAVQ